jgi:hypothetical protein
MALFQLLITALVGFGGIGAAQAAERPARFWNLTGETVIHLYVAPAGTERWSADQCRNDKDGTVDFDERLPISPLAPGRYDVKLSERSGRTCLVRDVEIKPGAVFSIGKEELTHCGQ